MTNGVRHIAMSATEKYLVAVLVMCRWTGFPLRLILQASGNPTGINPMWPILQAPMGDVTTPMLAASLSNPGGLVWTLADETSERFKAFR